jgi:LysM domain
MRRLGVLLLASLSSVSFPAIAQQDPDLVAQSPFNSQTAHDNLIKCDPSLANSLVDLDRVQQIYYEFDPPKGVASANQSTISISRYIQFSMPEMGISAIARRINTLNSDTCQATVRVSYIAVDIPDSQHIRVGYHIDIGEWDCGSFLGISYKTYIGSSWADVRYSYLLKNDLSISPERPPEVFNVGSSSTVLGDVVSVAASLFAPVGALLSSALNFNLMSNPTSFPAISDAGGTKAAFAAFSSGIGSLKVYANALDLMDGPYWPLSTQAADSGFTPHETTNPLFTLKQDGTLPAKLGQLAYTLRKAEIAYLRDLKTPAPRAYQVLRGESLWSIAAKTYTDPRIHVYLEDLNHLRRKRLAIGQVISLPLLSELCANVVVNDSLVRPRDTVFGIRHRHAGLEPKASQFRSRNLNLIYPYEGIIAGSGVGTRATH